VNCRVEGSFTNERSSETDGQEKTKVGQRESERRERERETKTPALDPTDEEGEKK